MEDGNFVIIFYITEGKRLGGVICGNALCGQLYDGSLQRVWRKGKGHGRIDAAPLDMSRPKSLTGQCVCTT